MTRDEFVKTPWKGYQSIDYITVRENIECLLIGMDFDGETMELCPLDTMYIQDGFTANIKYCFKHKRKMQSIK